MEGDAIDAMMEDTHRLAIAKGLVWLYRCDRCGEETQIVLSDDVAYPHNPEGWFEGCPGMLRRIRKVTDEVHSANC